MVEIPENQVSQADLAEWYQLKAELSRVKSAEMLLRTKIFKAMFPAPEEGTNSYPMEDGYVLKAKHTISREIDQGTFQAMREKFAEHGINPDAVVRWKPSLEVKEYRHLTEEQIQLFDQCLIIKPGSPSLEIVKPKKA